MFSEICPAGEAYNKNQIDHDINDGEMDVTFLVSTWWNRKCEDTSFFDSEDGPESLKKYFQFLIDRIEFLKKIKKGKIDLDDLADEDENIVKTKWSGQLKDCIERLEMRLEDVKDKIENLNTIFKSIMKTI